MFPSQDVVVAASFTRNPWVDRLIVAHGVIRCESSPDQELDVPRVVDEMVPSETREREDIRKGEDANHKKIRMGKEKTTIEGPSCVDRGNRPVKKQFQEETRMNESVMVPSNHARCECPPSRLCTLLFYRLYVFWRCARAGNKYPNGHSKGDGGH